MKSELITVNVQAVLLANQEQVFLALSQSEASDFSLFFALYVKRSYSVLHRIKCLELHKH